MIPVHLLTANMLKRLMIINELVKYSEIPCYRTIKANAIWGKIAESDLLKHVHMAMVFGWGDNFYKGLY